MQYIVTYSKVRDNANNLTEVNRTVHVKDTKKPTITPNGLNPVRVDVFDTYTDKNATVIDNHDPDRNITGDISEVNTSKLGDYNVTYDTNDSSGNVADTVKRLVKVEDKKTPSNHINSKAGSWRYKLHYGGQYSIY